MRLIDADALIKKCGDWYTEEGTEEGFIGTLKSLIDRQPTVCEWHPYNPMHADRDGLEDHHYYLVAVTGKETAMKAKYHIDSPFGFEPVPGEFDPMDVTGWMPLPEPPEVKQE